MTIFGLTNLDSICCALGLSTAWGIVDLLVFKTPVAIVVLLIALFLSLWRCAKSGHLKPLIRTAIIVVAISGLCVVPKTQIATIQSAQEVYGSKNPIPAYNIREGYLTVSYAPTLLLYGNQIATSLNLGIIHAIDAIFPQPQQFLKHQIQWIDASIVLAHRILSDAPTDPLINEVSVFIDSQFLPALTQMKNRGLLSVDFKRSIFTDDILNQMSDPMKEDWKTIRSKIMDRFNQDEQWQIIAEGLMAFGGISQEQVNDVIVELIFYNASRQLSPAPHPIQIEQFPRDTSLGIYGLLGISQWIVLAAFPFMLIALAISTSLSVLWVWLRMFIWVKSFMLTTAIAYYAALLMFKAKLMQTGNAFWLWHAPSHIIFMIAASIFLPIVTGILIKHRSQ